MSSSIIVKLIAEVKQIQGLICDRDLVVLRGSIQMLSQLEGKGRGSEAHALMRRALDLLPDGVLIIGSNREVLYTNAAFEALWRIPADVVRRGDQAMLNNVLDQLDDPNAFIELVQRLYRSPSSSEDELRFKDGRIFHRRSVALDVEDGGFSRIWIFSDVTEAWSARIDPLTGLFNRRAYAVELPDFIKMECENVVKAFALIDVDHFKSYNDQYGHAAGDAVLELLGNTFQAQLSGIQSTVFRIGGEEFAVISTHPEHHSAVHFHDQILEVVKRTNIAHAGNDPHGVVTISMGVGLFKGSADLKDIFATVDRALYRAKSHGRNSICLVDLDQRKECAANPVQAVSFSLQEGALRKAGRVGDGSVRTKHVEAISTVSPAKIDSSTIMQTSHLFDVLTESVPGFVWLADSHGNATSVNDNWLQHTGLSHLESLNKGWLSALHPLDVEKIQATWPLQATVGNSAHESQIRIKRTDGVYRWYLVRSNPLGDGSGRWIGCATDI
ncbi:MAG: diguanylate cyclase, partial [Cytophagaceae bacterium]